jgi:hypothetical protein
MDINQMVYDVARTCRLYEKGFTSVKRSPVDYQTRPSSLKEFIECRINYEAFKYPELVELEQKFDGRLFKVLKLENVNYHRNTFDKVIIVVNDELDEDDMNDITSKLGAKGFSFTSDKHHLGIELI